MSRTARLFLLLCALASLGSSGCISGANLHYITQAAAGQEHLNGRGIDIQEVIDHGYLDKRTRGLLAAVPGIKAFGERPRTTSATCGSVAPP
jgi:hypothetical protein